MQGLINIAETRSWRTLTPGSEINLISLAEAQPIMTIIVIAWVMDLMLSTLADALEFRY